ncbi:hypothetical protein [Roseovarius sp.]|uniref:hypothetical protein n=1 Tax=Roseovarius sp. TaxID=1486281 RepID=UPI003A974F46
MAQQFHEFDHGAVEAALDAARRRHEENDAAKNLTARSAVPAGGGHVALAAQCIAVTVENNKVCLNLPLGFGKHCFPLPVSIPNGTAAEACLDICTKFGIPTGIKVYIKVAGNTVLSETFGVC